MVVEEDETPDDMAAEDMHEDYDEELDFGLGSQKLGTGPFAAVSATGEIVQGKIPFHSFAHAVLNCGYVIIISVPTVLSTFSYFLLPTFRCV